MISMIDLYGLPLKTKEGRQYQTYRSFIDYIKGIEREAAHAVYGHMVEQMTQAQLETVIKADQRSWADFQTDEEYAYRCHIFMLAERAEGESFRRTISSYYLTTVVTRCGRNHVKTH